MCGISCCVSVQGVQDGEVSCCPICERQSNQENQAKMLKLKTMLESRGPDLSSSKLIKAKSIDVESSSSVHLSGHILWTQGAEATVQPYCDLSKTHYLLFNGDLYGGHLFPIKEAITEDFHDGLHVFNRLAESPCQAEFLEILSSLEGPFAFIFYNRAKGELWFGRDFFGRESLLVSYDDTWPRESLLISSLSVFRTVFEVPTSGIYCYRIFEREITTFEWKSHPRDQISSNFIQFKAFLAERDIVLKIDPYNHLKCIPTLLQPLPDDIGSNVLLSQLSLLSSLAPEEQVVRAAQILSSQINQFLIHLRSAVSKRVKVQPPYCKLCVKERQHCKHSRVGVLFSGGIDSTVLAYLAAECLQPGEFLDLLNVAFYQDVARKDKIPDRETGLAAFDLLRSKFPDIDIRFIPVDVSKAEVETIRRDQVRHLISPLTSVLDDSIGCCLWFAASGNGQSAARIVLLGSGADELLGGYSRHRSAFQNGGWEMLRQEMQFDVDRISVRNLGRDNRIVSDHGVAPRMPFLDEGVVQFLTGECDLWVKCCPLSGFNRGLGEKLLLRATAYTLLGNQGIKISLFPKRAMQFGSRIAKLENSKEKGSDKCQRLTGEFTDL